MSKVTVEGSQWREVVTWNTLNISRPLDLLQALQQRSRASCNRVITLDLCVSVDRI